MSTLSPATLLETTVILERRSGPAAACDLDAFLARAQIELEPVPPQHAKQRDRPNGTGTGQGEPDSRLRNDDRRPFPFLDTAELEDTTRGITSPEDVIYYDEEEIAATFPAGCNTVAVSRAAADDTLDHGNSTHHAQIRHLAGLAPAGRVRERARQAEGQRRPPIIAARYDVSPEAVSPRRRQSL